MSRGDLSENLDPNLPKVCPVPFYHWASPNPNDLKPVLLGNSRPTWCLGDVEDVNDVSWSFGRCLFMLRFVFFCKENILKWRILEGISPKGATTLLYQKWSKNSQEKQLPQDLALWGETPQLHTSSSAHGCQTEIGWEIPSEFYPFLIFSQTKSNERKSQNFPRRSKKKVINRVEHCPWKSGSSGPQFEIRCWKALWRCFLLPLGSPLPLPPRCDATSAEDRSPCRQDGGFRLATDTVDGNQKSGKLSSCGC